MVLYPQNSDCLLLNLDLIPQCDRVIVTHLFLTRVTFITFIFVFFFSLVIPNCKFCCHSVTSLTIYILFILFIIYKPFIVIKKIIITDF